MLKITTYLINPPKNVCAILHPGLQGHHDERGHVDAVAHREVAVGLEGADEEEEEGYDVLPNGVVPQVSSFVNSKA